MVNLKDDYSNSLSERSGVKTSFWDYLNLLISRLLSFPMQVFAVVLTTRLLGPEGYGHIALYNMVVSLGLMVSVDWTSGSLLRFGREEFELRQKINHTFWARTVILIPCLLVWLVIVSLFRNEISGYIGIPLWVTGLIMISVFLGGIHNYLIYILQAIKRMQAYALGQLIGNGLVVIGLTLIFLGFFPKNFITVITLGIVSGFFTIAIIFILWVPLDVLLPIKFERTLFKEIFQFSYPIVIGSISSYVVNWVDVMMIKKYLSLSHVGGYQVSYQTFLFTLTLLGVVSTIITPILISLFTNERKDIILRFITRLIPQGFLIWSVIVGIGLSLSPFIFQLVFGDQFNSSIIYFQFLCIGLVFNAIPIFYNGVMMAYKLIRHCTIINIIVALLNFFGDLLLVPTIGSLGAAISTSVAICSSAILNLLVCQRYLKINLFWQLNLILPILLTLGINHLIPGPLPQFLAIGINFLIGYYLAKKFHLFRYEDIFFLDYVKMPGWAKKIFINFYTHFSTHDSHKVVF